MCHNCAYLYLTPSWYLPVSHQSQEKADNSVHHPTMKTPELGQDLRISRSVAGCQPVVEGDVDSLLGKSVVRKAWVSGETIGSWLATIQKGDSLGGNSTYVMEDRFCHTIEE